MTTGERLKLRRKEIGFSAEKVADQLGVSPATIYRYEKGDIEKVPVDSLAELAKILQTTPAYLMGWESQADQAEINDLLAQIQASEEKEQSRIAEMIQDFKKLNDDGKAKAIERVHELTEIPRSDKLLRVAALGLPQGQHLRPIGRLHQTVHDIGCLLLFQITARARVLTSS